ncbi:MAG: helix-turn-helix transcriptional regulator [Steroidobacter sp.]
MDHPATRVLALLELLQTHGRMGGAELAQRLNVDRRTLRRYIARLEEIGVPVTTERGVHGGYRLIAGYKLPPMMFTNDEALVLSLGLVAARNIGLAEGAPAVASARAKLERVLPTKIQQRARALDETVSLERSGEGASGSQEMISSLSTAAHARQQVRMRYRAASGEESTRAFDPYGLAFRARRWYVAGFCRLRGGLRSFRLDRIVSVEQLAQSFERPADFDVLAHMAMSIATLPRAFAIEVVLRTDLRSAQRGLFSALGVLEPLGNSVLLRSQADDLAWFARELARLPWSFEVRQPAALEDAVRKHAVALIECVNGRTSQKARVRETTIRTRERVATEKST